MCIHGMYSGKYTFTVYSHNNKLLKCQTITIE